MREGSRASLYPFHPYRGLEGGVELGEKVGPASEASASQGQHAFLHQGAVHIIILYDHVFLQDLDGVELIGAPTLGQHHLETQAPKAQSIVGTLGVQVPAPPFQRHRNGNPSSFLSLSLSLWGQGVLTLPTTASGKASYLYASLLQGPKGPISSLWGLSSLVSPAFYFPSKDQNMISPRHPLFPREPQGSDLPKAAFPQNHEEAEVRDVQTSRTCPKETALGVGGTRGWGGDGRGGRTHPHSL